MCVCPRLKGLQLSAWLKKDTWLLVKPLEEGAPDPTNEPKPPPQMHLVNRVVQVIKYKCNIYMHIHLRVYVYDRYRYRYNILWTGERRK